MGICGEALTDIVHDYLIDRLLLVFELEGLRHVKDQSGAIVDKNVTTSICTLASATSK